MFKSRFFKIFFPVAAVLILFFGASHIFGMPSFVLRLFGFDLPPQLNVEERRELAEQGDKTQVMYTITTQSLVRVYITCSFGITGLKSLPEL